MSFRQRLSRPVHLIFDGAMGTMLQRRGMPPGVSPEAYCLANPEVLFGIHRDYAAAGAEVVTTNTFGGTRYKLPSNIPVFEFNSQMARAARQAAAACSRPVFVAGSLGPTGKFLHPLGDASFEEITSAYEEQVRGLLDGGVDLFTAETQFDLHEARAAIIAVRRLTGLPVIVSATYENQRTLTGSTVAVITASFANMGVDMIAVNCSLGPVELRPLVAELLDISPVPVLVQPNAGLPRLENGVTVFPMGPEEFARETAAFARAGAYGVGGCCGTGPEHIAALASVVGQLGAPGPRPRAAGICVTSRADLVRVGEGQPLRLIGERINPTGKKQLTAELQAGEFTTALRFSDEQAEAGAPLLDVNVGAPLVDETDLLPDLVARLAVRHNIPLVLDTANAEAMEKALAVYPGSPLINSISGEHGRLERLGPLCRDYGAPFILLPLKGKTLPVRAAERIAIVEELLARMDALRIPRNLAIVDILALSASSSPEAGRECLAFAAYCRDTLKLPTVCGLSNISFGLPARELINASFLALAAGAGLSACIANPGSARIREAVDSINLLQGYDEGAGHFISRYAGWTSGAGPAGSAGLAGAAPAVGGAAGESGVQGGADSPATPARQLAHAVILGRKDGIRDLVRATLDSGVDPFNLVSECLIPAITEVGAKYESKEYFLPQLIRSAEVMQAAFAEIRPLLEKDARVQERPVIILATVEGDIHDIGKNIVSLMLGNHGFEVVDLGKDVPAGAIVEEAMKRKARIIGLSALMTTTMVRMEDTLALIREKNLDQKVMVGGAVVTEDFARSIGAHYAKDAVEAVRLAQELLGQA